MEPRDGAADPWAFQQHGVPGTQNLHCTNTGDHFLTFITQFVPFLVHTFHHMLIRVNDLSIYAITNEVCYFFCERFCICDSSCVLP